jgi:hypothetical protein
MNEFDIRNKYEYRYVNGMEIAYIDENHDSATGIIKRHDAYSIELISGVIINKGRVYDVLSKEVESASEVHKTG